MKRVVMLLIVAFLFATMTWVTTSARDTPWGVYPDRDTGDDHPWGGEQLRPDGGPALSTTGGTTITRYYLVDFLTGLVIDMVSDWHANYRPYSVTPTSSDNSSTTGHQTHSTTPNQGQ